MSRRMARRSPSPRGSRGVRRRPPTRSRAPRTPTGGGRRSGTRSAGRPARCAAATPATSPATPTTATPRTPTCCARSACPPTGSRSPGRASSPPATGQLNQAGLDYYKRAARHARRARDHRRGDAVPLGPAAGAAGPRRLGRPGHRVPVRRLRRGRRRGARRPGHALDHAERAARRRAQRAPHRGARARADRRRGGRGGDAPPAARPRPRHRRACAPPSPPRRWGSRSTSPRCGSPPALNGSARGT